LLYVHLLITVITYEPFTSGDVHCITNAFCNTFTKHGCIKCILWTAFLTNFSIIISTLLMHMVCTETRR